MKEVAVKVYAYSELSDTAKESAYRDWLNSPYRDYPWTKEGSDAINALGDLFGVKCRNWEYGGGCSPSFDLKWNDDMNDARDLCGNRALAFFANRLWHQTYDEKYPSKDKCGRIICRTLAQVWDNCPMTGMWLDCDALQPLADFMQGKGDHKGRTLRAFNSTTVESVVRDCFRSLLAELDRDCEYCSSQEYFAEEAEANDYQFTDDGDRFTKAA
jgi:hypothetical protein